jgi:hypothetical protein
MLCLTGAWNRRLTSPKAAAGPASQPSPPHNVPAPHSGQPPGKALGTEDGRAYGSGYEGQLHLRGRASYQLAGSRCLTLSLRTPATGNGSPPVRDLICPHRHT